MSQDSQSALSPEAQFAATQPVGWEYRLFDVGKYIRLLWARRYLMLAFAAVGGIIGAIDAHMTPSAYDAYVRLMPGDRTESLISGLPIGRNEGDLYLGLISSRTVADDVIARQNLADYFGTTRPSLLRAMLAQMAKIGVDKDQFVTVTVRAKTPEMAVRVANEFPQALYRLNHSVALAKAGHRFEYYEGPLEDESKKLADAEEQLKLAQQKTGIVAPEAQVQLGLGAIASLKSQITGLQSQLAAAQTSGTDQNPEVVRLKTEIGSLSGQLNRLQAENGGNGRAPASASGPALTLEIDRKTRDVKFHEALFTILSRQYENARVEDSYSPPIELVDSAVLADQKAYPPRRLWAMVGVLMGAVTGFGFVTLRAMEPVRRVRTFFGEDAPAAAGSPGV